MLFEKITAEEQNAISSYIRKNIETPGIQERQAPLEDVLYYWEKNKSKYLYKLLGEELIYSRDITIQRSREILMNDMVDLIRTHSFTTWLNEATSYYTDDIFDLRTESRFVVQDLILTRSLVENRYFGSRNLIVFTNPDFKSIQVQEGCKPMKILKQIAENFDKLEEFEDFRIKHSRILSEKEFIGRLSLSIHPLDFMTMSDNDSDWSSCMSWRTCGSYRRGTVEMMNSPCVVVAYLSASKPMLLDRDSNFKWSNKKWRELFIVNENIITNVKGYPYCSRELTTTVLEILKELAETNCNFTYDENRFFFECDGDESYDLDNLTLSFETGVMYNDFDSATHYAYAKEGLEGNVYTYYSGPSTCMWCGEVSDFDHGTEEFESNLICDDCYNGVRCELCGGVVLENYIYEVDGKSICPRCYSEDAYETADDPFNTHLIENCTRIFLTPHPEDFPTSYYNGGYYILVYDMENEKFFNKYFNREVRTCTNAWGRTYHYFALEDCTDGTIETLFNISTDFELQIFKSCF